MQIILILFLTQRSTQDDAIFDANFNAKVTLHSINNNKCGKILMHFEVSDYLFLR